MQIAIVGDVQVVSATFTRHVANRHGNRLRRSDAAIDDRNLAVRMAAENSRLTDAIARHTHQSFRVHGVIDIDQTAALRDDRISSVGAISLAAVP